MKSTNSTAQRESGQNQAEQTATVDGSDEFINNLNNKKWAYIMQEVTRQEQIRRDQYEEWRKREQCRIWLEHIGSPLAPYTMVMQDEVARVGSSIYMCAAVSMAESSGALDCHGFNAWGLGGSTNYRTFGCWEEGIRAFYQFLWDWNISRGYAATSGMTTPNYCEPWPGTWAPEVDSYIREIQAIEVAPYKSGP